jgi:hypothetical protein
MQIEEGGEWDRIWWKWRMSKSRQLSESADHIDLKSFRFDVIMTSS